ncbi:MAG: DUF4105 domain-containing protein [Moraxellaceae bacterium]|nr:DUF4105 domain-containing protein [Moraxellaceae bacterium]MDZ4297404.1 DUF4105 domain-containing protein [Moraxellaceae bacterium]MDZ4386632.1 DUF4105 domain-containing protein [Moraxellaceae bacterium]
MKYLLIIVTAFWAGAALWHAVSLPPTVSGQVTRIALPVAWGLFALVVLVLLWCRTGGLLPIFIYVVGFLLVAVWWALLSPSNERDWADEVAEMTHGDVTGSLVTLHNVRNFDWRTTTDYTPRWESREYDLDSLSSVDLILSYWAGPAIAHVLVSFGFDDGRYVTFSVEVRKERHEKFSELGGFFKRFELSVVAADERDIVRVRTNVRDDPPEQVSLYRIALGPEARRSLFLAYIDEANSLKRQPRFYHTLTTNCTTLVWHMMKRIVPGLPLDYRLLLSGYLPDYAYDVAGLDGRYTFAELKTMADITARARATDLQDDYSAAIRVGIPSLP